MSSRRMITTYSKRKPVARMPLGEGIEGEGEESTEDILAVTSGKNGQMRVVDTKGENELLKEKHSMAIKESVGRGDWLDRLGQSIAKLVIAQEEPKREHTGRKSQIVPPRRSIAPTHQELDLLLELCEQEKETVFEAWFEKLSRDWKKLEKIGESSFSEVFKLSDPQKGPTDGLALKIMPLCEADGKIASKIQSPEPIPISNLLHEIRTLKALGKLDTLRKYAIPSGFTGFNRMISCSVLKGPYPSGLQDAWDRWGEAKETENESPSVYGEESVHVAIVMEFGGEDLENFAFQSLSQIKAALHQILLALTLAEQRLQFEHRDLHLGNVLVKHTHRSDIRLETYQMVPTEGILCSIIDCSLSRLKEGILSNTLSNCVLFSLDDDPVLYRDLSQEQWLFEGDSTNCQQYEIYRVMRKLNEDEWRRYEPRSNLLWVKHLARELLQRHTKLAKKDKTAARVLKQIEAFTQRINSYRDSSQAIRDEIFKE